MIVLLFELINQDGLHILQVMKISYWLGNIRIHYSQLMNFCHLLSIPLVITSAVSRLCSIINYSWNLIFVEPNFQPEDETGNTFEVSCHSPNTPTSELPSHVIYVD